MLMTSGVGVAAYSDLQRPPHHQALRIVQDFIETCPTGSQSTWAAKLQRLALPYCVMEVDGRLLPLNRHYKVLGMSQLFDHVNYKPFVPAFGIDPQAIPGKVADGAGSHYFFNDGNPPWAGKRYMVSYLERVSDFFGFNDLRDHYPQIGAYR